ncbi:unnamed protein product [Rotaria sp. Silwood2]|nr:unnamed protein product [Rotaria sp. Silwood2]CAF2856639.1 unnamed protein product [Rotaria sp. Silwood2]CAF3100065.1 unnamed protein product [Rotaria sp. Silwood2]CAF4001147.1 unnamed protein product [Rotaria sp. Silwood2]CAF4189719.1 unnamed protein product [Rotaria sp. Silwood2]
MSHNHHTGKNHCSSNDILLDKPSTEKELYADQSFGFGTMQGWRKTHEDFHKHLIPFDNQHWKNWSYFAIFDGHCGVDTAKNAARFLDKYLLESFNQCQSNIDLHQFHKIIKNTFIHLDKNLMEVVKDHSGSVCIAALISPKSAFLINIGDCRGIIISKDGQILSATKDHKPDVRKEQERIRKAGGHITKPKNSVLRVEDKLAMTRALGDYSLDKNVIPALPDVIEYPRDSSAAYLIIASDGIWDVMSNEQVASFISQRASNTTLDDIISQLFDYCLQQQSTDNMTIYVVKLD